MAKQVVWDETDIIGGIRFLIEASANGGLSRRAIAERTRDTAGTPVGEAQLSRLMSPKKATSRGLSLGAAQAVANVLGYEIVLRPMKKTKR